MKKIGLYFFFLLGVSGFTELKAQEIKDVLSRKGVWKVNEDDSFVYLNQGVATEDSPDRIYQHLFEASFIFHEGVLLHYGKLKYTQVFLEKYYFKIDEDSDFILAYRDKDCTGEVALHLYVKSVDESRITFFIPSYNTFFICDYANDQKKWKQMMEATSPLDLVDITDFDFKDEEVVDSEEQEAEHDYTNYNHIVSGKWVVDSEKTFEQLIASTMETDKNEAQKYYAQKEQLLHEMKNMRLFFDKDTDQFYIKSQIISDEGFFDFRGTTIYVNLYKSEATKEKGEILLIESIDDKQFVFDYKNRIYYAYKQ